MCSLISKKTSVCLKGILALMIFLHHVYQNTLLGSQYDIIDYVLRSFGLWGVSAFFLLSGYGLMYSISGGGYFDKLKRKCVNLYILTLGLIFLYCVSNIVLGISMSPSLIYKSFVFGGTIVGAGWYLQVILVCYIAVLLIWRYVEKYKVFSYTCFVLAFIFVMALRLPSHWYISLLALPVGMGLYKFEYSIMRLLSFNKKYVIVLSLSLMLFLFSTCWIYFSPTIEYGKLITLGCRFTQGIFFALLMVLIAQKINVDSFIARFLGEYSLEIFLLQGISFALLKNSYWQISSPYTYLLLAFIFTILLSIVLKPSFSYILSLGLKNKVR